MLVNNMFGTIFVFQLPEHRDYCCYGNHCFFGNQIVSKGERGVIVTRTTFLLTAPLFFTFLTSNFPTLFVLPNFIL